MPQTYDEIFSASNFLADYDVHRVKNKSTGRFLSNFCVLLRIYKLYLKNPQKIKIVGIMHKFEVKPTKIAVVLYVVHLFLRHGGTSLRRPDATHCYILKIWSFEIRY